MATGTRAPLDGTRARRGCPPPRAESHSSRHICRERERSRRDATRRREYDEIRGRVRANNSFENLPIEPSIGRKKCWKALPSIPDRSRRGRCVHRVARWTPCSPLGSPRPRTTPSHSAPGLTTLSTTRARTLGGPTTPLSSQRGIAADRKRPNGTEGRPRKSTTHTCIMMSARLSARQQEQLDKVSWIH